MKRELSVPKDPCALVTGASRGIGRAIAFRLAESGFRVALGARNQEQIQEAASSIRAAGGESLAVPLDVADSDSVSAAVRQVEDRWGAIDILVNNAGIALFDDILSSKISDWISMFEVNVLGALRATQAVLPGMLERDFGRIVMIASTASHKAYPKQAGYCASKGALLSFARVLLEELKGTGVRIHLVSPGGVDTELARSTRDPSVADEYMAPEEVAEAVLFLLHRRSLATVDEIILRRHPASPML